MVSTWSDTESRSSMVMPRMFMVLLQVPIAIGGATDKEGLIFRITTISRVLAGFRWRFFWAAPGGDIAELIVHRLDITRANKEILLPSYGLSDCDFIPDNLFFWPH